MSRWKLFEINSGTVIDPHKDKESLYKKYVRIWRKASGDRWWLFSYFKIGYEEMQIARNSADDKKPKWKSKKKQS